MKNFFKKIGNYVKAHKKRTILVSVLSFVLVCAIITLSCLGTFLFNRFNEGIVPNATDLANAYNKYKRVLIIGVDGVGDYFARMKETVPNFNKLFGGFYTDIDGQYCGTESGAVRVNGSVTFKGYSVYPTVSAENWCSMFHGVRPLYHGIVFQGSNQEVENGVHPNEKYPSFMKNYLDQNPNEKILSVCTWRGVNNGVIEDMDNITKLNTNKQDIFDLVNGTSTRVTDSDFIDYLTERTSYAGFVDETEELSDALTCQTIIEMTATEDYKIAYMHFDQVDHAGHSYGYNSSGYVQAVSRVDVLIGKLFDAYNERGWLNDTLFVLCSDHGHRYEGGHGRNSDTEKYVTFAISGRTVKQGTPGKYVNDDLAAIITYGLGAKAASTWQGRVPYNMFTTLDNYMK